MMMCRCGKMYVGKGWEGIGHKGIRRRMGQHSSKAIAIKEKLSERGFYDAQGRVIKNARKRAQIVKEVQMDENKKQSEEDLAKQLRHPRWTGDLDHMLGIDGTSCYLTADRDDPSSNMTMFAIDMVTKYERSDAVQADLAEKERYWQGRLCTVYHPDGLNGTPDWNYDGVFARDTAKTTKAKYALRFDKEETMILTEHIKPPLTDAYMKMVEGLSSKVMSLTHHDLPLPRLVRAHAFPKAAHCCDRGHPLTRINMKQMKQAIEEQRLLLLGSKCYVKYAVEEPVLHCGRLSCRRRIASSEYWFHCAQPQCDYDVCYDCFGRTKSLERAAEEEKEEVQCDDDLGCEMDKDDLNNAAYDGRDMDKGSKDDSPDINENEDEKMEIESPTTRGQDDDGENGEKDGQWAMFSRINEQMTRSMERMTTKPTTPPRRIECDWQSEASEYGDSDEPSLSPSTTPRCINYIDVDAPNPFENVKSSTTISV